MRTVPILLLGLLALQPAPTGIRLIVKGDDMAAGHGINVATIDAYKRGVLTTTNVIVPGPWFPEAARLLNENPGLDVGVHLALTSEWDNVKWRPLTPRRRSSTPDGYFFPMVKPRRRCSAGDQHQGKPLDIDDDRARAAGAAGRWRTAPAAGDLHVEPHGVHVRLARRGKLVAAEQGVRAAGAVGAGRSDGRPRLRRQGHRAR